MNWKVISFYTKDYKDEADILIKSLDKFSIPYDIELVKSKGAWKENTFYKMLFIEKKLKQYNQPLVWLDADAGVIQYPTQFDGMGDALMAGIYSPWKPREFIGNTIYFVPSKEVFEFLEQVNRFIKEAPLIYPELIGEQLYTQKILESNNWMERLKFRELPFSYGMPFYWKESPHYSLYKKPFVIMQRQASRRKDPIRRNHYAVRGVNIVKADTELLLKMEI